MRALVTRVRSNSSWNRWKKLLLVRPLSRKRRGRKKKESYKALYVNMQTPKKTKKQNKNETKTKQQTVTEILALQRNAEKQLSYKYLIAFLKVFMSHEIG